MNDAQFDQILGERVNKTQRVLGKKAVEYARGDRLHNFKVAAGLMHGTPEKACVAFWIKHVVSIIDLVDDLQQGKVAPADMWDEKIGDGINYLILLEALVKERLSTRVEVK